MRYNDKYIGIWCCHRRGVRIYSKDLDVISPLTVVLEQIKYLYTCLDWCHFWSLKLRVSFYSWVRIMWPQNNLHILLNLHSHYSHSCVLSCWLHWLWHMDNSHILRNSHNFFRVFFCANYLAPLYIIKRLIRDYWYLQTPVSMYVTSQCHILKTR